jgi:hypothetical protein
LKIATPGAIPGGLLFTNMTKGSRVEPGGARLSDGL